MCIYTHYIYGFFFDWRQLTAYWVYKEQKKGALLKTLKSHLGCVSSMPILPSKNPSLRKIYWWPRQDTKEISFSFLYLWGFFLLFTTPPSILATDIAILGASLFTASYNSHFSPQSVTGWWQRLQQYFLTFPLLQAPILFPWQQRK